MNQLAPNNRGKKRKDREPPQVRFAYWDSPPHFANPWAAVRLYWQIGLRWCRSGETVLRDVAMNCIHSRLPREVLAGRGRSDFGSTILHSRWSFVRLRPPTFRGGDSADSELNQPDPRICLPPHSLRSVHRGRPYPCRFSSSATTTGTAKNLAEHGRDRKLLVIATIQAARESHFFSTLDGTTLLPTTHDARQAMLSYDLLSGATVWRMRQPTGRPGTPNPQRWR